MPCHAAIKDDSLLTHLLWTNLLIEQSPENGERQEHVGDRLEGLHVLDERPAVLLLGVVQDRLLLLRLPALGPLLQCVLHQEQTGLSFRRGTAQ